MLYLSADSNKATFHMLFNLLLTKSNFELDYALLRLGPVL